MTGVGSIGGPDEPRRTSSNVNPQKMEAFKPDEIANMLAGLSEPRRTSSDVDPQENEPEKTDLIINPQRLKNLTERQKAIKNEIDSIREQYQKEYNDAVKRYNEAKTEVDKENMLRELDAKLHDATINIEYLREELKVVDEEILEIHKTENKEQMKELFG